MIFSCAFGNVLQGAHGAATIDSGMQDREQEASMKRYCLAVGGAAFLFAVGPANAAINLTYTITIAVAGSTEPDPVFHSPETGVPMGPPPVSDSIHPGVDLSLQTTPTSLNSWHLSFNIKCVGLQCSIKSWSPDLYDTVLKREVPIEVRFYGPGWTPDWSNPLNPVFYPDVVRPPLDPQSVTATIATIPEPSTWITVLIGFGVMGAFSRRVASTRPALES